MSRWGQLERGNLAVGIMQHPYRKHPAIVVRKGSVLHTVAYCRDETEADRFWAALLELVDHVDDREAA